MDIDERFAELLAKTTRQHGLVTVAQLFRLGFKAEEFQELRQRRLLAPVGHDVFEVRGCMLSPRLARGSAEWLATDPARYAWERPRAVAEGVVLSHSSAARFHLWNKFPPTTEYTSQTPLDLPYPATVHIGQLTEADVMWVEGIPVTTPLRTLADVMTPRYREGVSRAVTACAHEGTFPLTELYEVCRPLLPQMGYPSTPRGFLGLFLDDLFPADLPDEQRRDYALLFRPHEVGQASAALASALAATTAEGQVDAPDVVDRAAAAIVAARHWPSKKRRSEVSELDDDHP